MKTRTPAPSPCLTKATRSSGARCALSTRTTKGTPNPLRTVHASLAVGKSLSLPIIRATSGEAIIFRAPRGLPKHSAFSRPGSGGGSASQNIAAKRPCILERALIRHAIDAECPRNGGICYLSLTNIYALSQGGVFGDGAVEAFLDELENVLKRHIAQGISAGPAHRAGHIGHTVIDHIVHDIGRLTMRSRPRSLDAATLIDRHIDDHRPRPHALDIVSAHEVRRLGSRDEHGADQEVGPRNAVEDVVAVAIKRGHVARHDVIEIAQAVETDVKDGDVGAQPCRDLGGVGADNSTAEHNAIGGQDARYSHPENAR